MLLLRRAMEAFKPGLGKVSFFLWGFLRAPSEPSFENTTLSLWVDYPNLSEAKQNFPPVLKPCQN